jgi:hypothetical protein
MLDRIFKALKRWAASSERDRMAEKFDHVDDNFSAMDERIDRLEIGQTEMKSEMKSIHEVGLANLELLEQKINSGKSGLEMHKEYMKEKFDSFTKTLEKLENLIMTTFKPKD